MAAKRNAATPPPLETPNEDIVNAIYPIGEAILGAIKYLESADGDYPGWTFFLQTFFETMHYAMTGERL